MSNSVDPLSSNDGEPIGYCPQCDYQLINPGACPECGLNVSRQQIRTCARSARRRRRLFVASRALGLLVLIVGSVWYYRSYHWVTWMPTTVVISMFPDTPRTDETLTTRIRGNELTREQIDRLLDKSHQYTIQMDSEFSSDVPVSFLLTTPYERFPLHRALASRGVGETTLNGETIAPSAIRTGIRGHAGTHTVVAVFRRPLDPGHYHLAGVYPLTLNPSGGGPFPLTFDVPFEAEFDVLKTSILQMTNLSETRSVDSIVEESMRAAICEIGNREFVVLCSVAELPLPLVGEFKLTIDGQKCHLRDSRIRLKPDGTPSLIRMQVLGRIRNSSKDMRAELTFEPSSIHAVMDDVRQFISVHAKWEQLPVVPRSRYREYERKDELVDALGTGPDDVTPWN